MAGGDTVLASDHNLEAWTSYTPVWSASTGTPSLGNGTITGKYRTNGKTGFVKIVLTWGSTTSAAGTGLWCLSLPFTPVADSLLQAYVDDNSAAVRWSGTARIISASATGNNMRIVVTAGNAGINSTAQPMTWATSDFLIVAGALEIA